MYDELIVSRFNDLKNLKSLKDYNIVDLEKAVDDGEPSGTAGKPILSVIQKKQLKNVCIFVVRYFGGVKLGAGGLVRAYTKASSEVLKY